MKVIFFQSVQVDGRPYFKGDTGEISKSMYETLLKEGVKVEKAEKVEEQKKEIKETKEAKEKNDNKV